MKLKLSTKYLLLALTFIISFPVLANAWAEVDIWIRDTEGNPMSSYWAFDYYNNDAIPQWKNSLLLAVLKDSELLQLKLNSAGDKIDAANDIGPIV